MEITDPTKTKASGDQNAGGGWKPPSKGKAIGSPSAPAPSPAATSPQGGSVAEWKPPSMGTPIGKPVTPPPPASKPYVSNPDTEAFKRGIHNVESPGEENPYEALPWKTKNKKELLSSAAGKYQHLWDSNNEDITRDTGITTKDAFLKSPDAQEQFMDNWIERELTPGAEAVRRLLPKKTEHLSDDDLRALVHFQGRNNAIKFLKTGQMTGADRNVSVETYLKRFRDGVASIPLSPEEINQRKNIREALELGVPDSPDVNTDNLAGFGVPTELVEPTKKAEAEKYDRALDEYYHQHGGYASPQETEQHILSEKQRLSGIAGLADNGEWGDEFPTPEQQKEFKERGKSWITDEKVIEGGVSSIIRNNNDADEFVSFALDKRKQGAVTKRSDKMLPDYHGFYDIRSKELEAQWKQTEASFAALEKEVGGVLPGMPTKAPGIEHIGEGQIVEEYLSQEKFAEISNEEKQMLRETLMMDRQWDATIKKAEARLSEKGFKKNEGVPVTKEEIELAYKTIENEGKHQLGILDDAYGQIQDEIQVDFDVTAERVIEELIHDTELVQFQDSLRTKFEAGEIKEEDFIGQYNGKANEMLIAHPDMKKLEAKSAHAYNDYTIRWNQAKEELDGKVDEFQTQSTKEFQDAMARELKLMSKKEEDELKKNWAELSVPEKLAFGWKNGEGQIDKSIGGLINYATGGSQLGNKFVDAGRQIEFENQMIDVGEFSAGQVLSADWWATRVMPSVPLTATLMAPGLGLYGASAGALGRMGLVGLSQNLIAGTIAGGGSRILESGIEAGIRYEDMLNRGFSPEYAGIQAAEIAQTNMWLAVTDITQMTLLFVPVKGVAPILGKFGTQLASEAAEELFQEAIPLKQDRKIRELAGEAHPENDPAKGFTENPIWNAIKFTESPAGREVATIGAAMGFGFGFTGMASDVSHRLNEGRQERAVHKLVSDVIFDLQDNSDIGRPDETSAETQARRKWQIDKSYEDMVKQNNISEEQAAIGKKQIDRAWENMTNIPTNSPLNKERRLQVASSLSQIDELKEQIEATKSETVKAALRTQVKGLEKQVQEIHDGTAHGYFVDGAPMSKQEVETLLENEDFTAGVASGKISFSVYNDPQFQTESSETIKNKGKLEDDKRIQAKVDQSLAEDIENGTEVELVEGLKEPLAAGETISDRYMKAKKDGSDPQFIAAVNEKVQAFEDQEVREAKRQEKIQSFEGLETQLEEEESVRDATEFSWDGLGSVPVPMMLDKLAGVTRDLEKATAEENDVDIAKFTSQQEALNNNLEIAKKEAFSTEEEKVKGVDKLINQLDNMDQQLKDFGKETLGINLPVVVARVGVKALKGALVAGKSMVEATQAGLEAIKKTDWYQKLDKAEREEAVDGYIFYLNEKLRPNSPKGKTKTQKGIDKSTKRPLKKVVTNEYSLLKKKLQDVARGARIGSTEVNKVKEALVKELQLMIKENKDELTLPLLNKALNSLKNKNLSTEKGVQKVLDTIEEVGTELAQKRAELVYAEIRDAILNQRKIQTQNGQRKAIGVSFEGEAYLNAMEGVIKTYMGKEGMGAYSSVYGQQIAAQMQEVEQSLTTLKVLKNGANLNEEIAFVSEKLHALNKERMNAPTDAARAKLTDKAKPKPLKTYPNDPNKKDEVAYFGEHVSVPNTINDLLDYRDALMAPGDPMNLVSEKLTGIRRARLEEKRAGLDKKLTTSIDVREDILMEIRGIQEKALEVLAAPPSGKNNLRHQQAQYELIATEDMLKLLDSETTDDSRYVLRDIKNTIENTKEILGKQVKAEAIRIQSLHNEMEAVTNEPMSGLTDQEIMNNSGFRAIDEMGRFVAKMGQDHFGSGVKGWTMDIVLDSYQYLTQVIDLKSNEFEGRAHELLHREGVLAAEKEKITNSKESRTKLHDAYERIFGRNKYAEFVGLHKKDYKPNHKSGVTRMVDGKRVEQTISKDSAMYLYALSQNDKVRSKMKEQGWDAQTIQDIREFVGDKHVEFTDWVVQEYLPELGVRYNEKHFEVFRTTFGHVDNYFPLSYEQQMSDENIDPNGIEIKFPSLAPNSVKTRKENNRPIDSTESFFGMLNDYVAEMEHFSAYGGVTKDLVSLLNNDRFMKNLELQQVGLSRVFKDSSFRALGKTTKAGYAATQGVRAIMKLEIGMSLSALFMNYYSHFKQLGSFPAAFSHTTNNSWVPGIGAARLLTSMVHELPYVVTGKTFSKLLKEEPIYHNRISSGNFGEESIDAMQSGTTHAGNVLTKKDLWKLNSWIPTLGVGGAKWMDALTVGWTGAALKRQVYNANKRAGLSDAEASKAASNKFNSFVSTQQSSQLYDMSTAQNKDFALSMFARFKNAQFSYFRNYYGSLQNINQRFEREKELAGGNRFKATQKVITNRETRQDLNRFFIFAFALPGIWAYMGRGLPGLMTGWDDDDSQAILHGTLLGPTDGWMFASNGIQGANYLHQEGLGMGAAIEETTRKQSTISPAAISIGLKSLGEVARTADELGAFNEATITKAIEEGLQLKATIDVERFPEMVEGLTKAIEGEVMRGTLEAMGAPSSVLEEFDDLAMRKKTVEDDQKKKVRERSDVKRNTRSEIAENEEAIDADTYEPENADAWAKAYDDGDDKQEIKKLVYKHNTEFLSDEEKGIMELLATNKEEGLISLDEKYKGDIPWDKLEPALKSVGKDRADLEYGLMKIKILKEMNTPRK